MGPIFGGGNIKVNANLWDNFEEFDSEHCLGWDFLMTHVEVNPGETPRHINFGIKFPRSPKMLFFQCFMCIIMMLT